MQMLSEGGKSRLEPCGSEWESWRMVVFPLFCVENRFSGESKLRWKGKHRPSKSPGDGGSDVKSMGLSKLCSRRKNPALPVDLLTDNKLKRFLHTVITLAAYRYHRGLIVNPRIRKAVVCLNLN